MFSTVGGMTILVELAYEAGLDPKKVSACEYHSSCPDCGGKDRFIIWLRKERYWCRRCGKSGDAIQFCRDFLGMSYSEAHVRVGSHSHEWQKTSNWTPSTLVSSPRPWLERAEAFTESAHQRLLVEPAALELLRARGLSIETMKRHRLGWHPLKTYAPRESWGLEKIMHNGREKQLCLPAGIAIPTLMEDAISKIKIRRADWHEADRFGKYYQIPGGCECPSVFGDPACPLVVLVEAELDGMLVAQEAGDLCACVAVGGTKKNPDVATDDWLRSKESILYALDFDDAGMEAYPFWQSLYPQLVPWPVPRGKAPAEAVTQHGINLRAWIATQLTMTLHKMP